MTILCLPSELWERGASIARSALPHEACALVSGPVGLSDGFSTDPGEAIAVTGLHPVRNSLRSPTSFAMDGEEMIAAERVIDDRGHRLIGILHSHPTSDAFPSARDLADARQYDPNAVLVQLIVSLQGFTPTIRAFRYDPNGGDPSAVELITGP